jgi:hypothetical protein
VGEAGAVLDTPFEAKAVWGTPKPRGHAFGSRSRAATPSEAEAVLDTPFEAKAVLFDSVFFAL